MEYGVRAELLERGRHGGAIADVDPRQRHIRGKRLLVTLEQVVDDNNIVPTGHEARDSSAPDIPGASGDGDSHVSSHPLPLGRLQVQVPDCRIDVDRAFPLDGPTASFSKIGATDA